MAELVNTQSRTDAAKRELREHYAGCAIAKPSKPTKREREAKPKKRIPKISDARRDAMRRCAQIKAEKILIFGNVCQVAILENCDHKAQCLHHLEKQGQGGEDTHENTLLSCLKCNLAVESSAELARKLGLVISAKAIAELEARS